MAGGGAGRGFRYSMGWKRCCRSRQGHVLRRGVLLSLGGAGGTLVLVGKAGWTLIRSRVHDEVRQWGGHVSAFSASWLGVFLITYFACGRLLAFSEHA